MFFDSQVSSYLFFGGTWIWIQGFMLVKQVLRKQALYCLSHTPLVHFVLVFWRWDLLSYLPGLALNWDPPNLSLLSSWTTGACLLSKFILTLVIGKKKKKITSWQCRLGFWAKVDSGWLADIAQRISCACILSVDCRWALCSKVVLCLSWKDTGKQILLPGSLAL
jgi:hypothetical protein